MTPLVLLLFDPSSICPPRRHSPSPVRPSPAPPRRRLGFRPRRDCARDEDEPRPSDCLLIQRATLDTASAIFLKGTDKRTPPAGCRACAEAKLGRPVSLSAWPISVPARLINLKIRLSYYFESLNDVNFKNHLLEFYFAKFCKNYIFGKLRPPSFQIYKP